MNTRYVSLLDSYFDFVYAEEIKSVLHDVCIKNCGGCTINSLSQLDRTCLLTMKEQLQLYWDYILHEINEEGVIEKWYGMVYTMKFIPLVVVDFYKLKLECRDWRETNMKTETWKKRMINMTLTLIHLEARFS